MGTRRRIPDATSNLPGVQGVRGYERRAGTIKEALHLRFYRIRWSRQIARETLVGS
jgi:hypothetical protein